VCSVGAVSLPEKCFVSHVSAVDLPCSVRYVEVHSSLSLCTFIRINAVHM